MIKVFVFKDRLDDFGGELIESFTTEESNLNLDEIFVNYDSVVIRKVKNEIYEE